MKLTRPSVLTCCAVLALALAGCASDSGTLAPQPVAKPALEFVDLQSFDRELSAALSAPFQKVDVAFFDRITPSSLPDRLQHWMTSVQAGGGTVKVLPPSSSVTAKSPLLLISLLSSAWTASEAVKTMTAQAQYKPAHAFDAQIILKTDSKGDAVVDRVIFLKR